MFAAEIYRQRRLNLVRQLKGGIVLLLGNVASPFNAADNCYRFRQDSSFLYFCGLDQPGLAVILDVDSGRETLFGRRQNLDDLIWSGPQVTLQERAEKAGIARSTELSELCEILSTAVAGKREVHYLPNCRAENKIILGDLFGRSPDVISQGVSPELIKATVALRSIKSAEELTQLDEAADLGYQLHTTAMRMAQPGRYEWEIAGELEAVAARAGRMLSFPPIVTVHGEILHNHDRNSQLQQGDLLLVDAGVESTLHYASDHTRTSPVGGRFSPRQKDIYQVVLATMECARELIRPGMTYLDVHLAACRTLVEGLQSLGLMHGDAEKAVVAGAHALFMPHGLGHQLGLDVHDMESLGEDFVGYDDNIRRSSQFGLSSLRLGRELQKGFVLTVEPGIYFIPALIAQWQDEGRHADYINYAKLEKYLNFGGIRLEDDIVVTISGNRLLGRPLPLQIAAVENTLNLVDKNGQDYS
ncbi:Xaa-Pro aminopeptidase [Desulfuromusa kysingii]|uniref:Xaa-Pro aminopeptidase n=1 Tax=Desulfuromusa kysingii TaxID=37625 RepID=A0A1H3VFK3_9BACT|nr:aminopeptidase P family protein [Desulfuromusa kysingii]SDZ73536.1 Xaa-Pro aminopeptidase [Desulfuromusa kysingii]